MAQTFRIKFNPQTREIEVDGTEAFVQKYFSILSGQLPAEPAKPAGKKLDPKKTAVQKTKPAKAKTQKTSKVKSPKVPKAKDTKASEKKDKAHIPMTNEIIALGSASNVG